MSKEKVDGRRKRKYGVPKTPYQHLMESNQVSEEVKEELKDVYLGLNPAELKRGIEAKVSSTEFMKGKGEHNRLILTEGWYPIRLHLL